MKKKYYWTYNRRHPRPRGPVSPAELMYRMFDHLDDSIIGLVAYIEFRRIDGRRRLMNHSIGTLTYLTRRSEKRIEQTHRRSA